MYHNIIDSNCVRSSTEIREETHPVPASALHLCIMAVFPGDVAALFQEDSANNATAVGVSGGATLQFSASQQEVSFVQGTGE